MTELTRAQIEQAVQSCVDPCLDRPLTETGKIRDVVIDNDRLAVTISLGYPAGSHHAALADSLRGILAPVAGDRKIAVTITTGIISHAVQKGIKPLQNIKNIIAVASGKGGVGKSTTAVNLALALQAEGAVVGILDADLYGPSQPRMLGSTSRPESSDGKSMEPVVSLGLQSMSIGYLVEEDTPMIWRGPMVTQALEQLLRDTRWRPMDYLVIDLPPGTGDTQLTLAQKIPVSGAVIVTTPQDISLLDARKALKMFERVEVPVLGIIENMSTHICSQCGHEEHIFGAGGGQRMADEYGVPMLGALPLDITIRENADGGTPTVYSDPDSAISRSYRDIACRAAARLSLQAKDYSSRFPEIVIEKS